MQALVVALVVAGALFVWLTSGSLPQVVATHFGMSGKANAFMSRAGYTSVMLAFVVGLPLLLSLAGRLISALPTSLVNLPNKSYWLSPPHRAATVRSFSTWSSSFAIVLLIFLCYVHWLVVQANVSAAAEMPPLPFLTGLALFVAATIAWVVALYRRFGIVR